MAFDQPTRNRLANFVSKARTKLTEEFTRQLQHVYGLDPDSGDVTPIERLTTLDDARRETSRILRETMEYYLAGKEETAKNRREALERIVREQAFTVLNRLCALRMAEARGLVLESIARGYQSQGFQLYSRLAGTALGETGDAYRNYLFSLFDEFAVDLPVLFDRYNPQGRLFPRETALLNVLGLINDPEIAPLWAEDETIGWIYQYFNSKEERQKMRAESQAPRNSRELAVRNQFFTPRYVVEFLTDNTLGRIWYEMTRGETHLKDTCRYLVRRPTEIFLSEGEQAPAGTEPEADLSQEELLKQPVYIPHRPLKDPREIKMLDPACGSMHFGLYAFDLFEHIYAEAWELEERLGADALQRLADLEPLHQTYPDKESYLRDVPRLIIERNIHGVDIDPRAVQIAGLSLWLRAQRSWQVQGLKPHMRLQIRKSNIVCAEPMPGDRKMLEEFLAMLSEEKLEALMRQVWHVPAGQKVRATQQMADALAKLVRTVWQEMELAGEAGSLLKIEETLRTAIAASRREAEEKAPLFRLLEYGLNEPPKEQYVQLIAGEEKDFFDRAEGLVLAALHEYAEQAENGGGYRRRLFAGDAVQGFSFIDLCRKQYDVVLMNPPFGEMAQSTKSYLEEHFPNSKADIYTCFVDLAVTFRSLVNGLVGVISNRTFLTLGAHTQFRQKILIQSGRLDLLVDLGSNILDAALVEVAAYVVSNTPESASTIAHFLPIHTSGDKASSLLKAIKNNAEFLHIPLYRFFNLPNSSFAYWLPETLVKHFSSGIKLEGGVANARVGLQTSDDFRFVRLRWEVANKDIGLKKHWIFFAKGGEFSPYHDDIHLVVNWKSNGIEIKGFVDHEGKQISKPQNTKWYFSSGLTYPWRTSLGFAPRVLPKDCIFAAQGSAMLPLEDSVSPKEDLLCVLGALNSSLFQVFISIGVGAVENAARSYQVGLVQSLPWTKLKDETKKKLSSITASSVAARQKFDYFDETTNLYQTTACTTKNFNQLDKILYRQMSTSVNLLADNYQMIDTLVNESFGVEDQIPSSTSIISKSFNGRLWSKVDVSCQVLSQMLGCAFGRWDIRYATGEKNTVIFHEPFAPLPNCPPGMLQNALGVPTGPEDLSSDYPIRVSWRGVLVDDEGYIEDIELRVRETLRVIWLDYAEAFEQEACQILKVHSLREYFRKPTLFFANHLKRYSKSRRMAPIYWPLSTPSCSYTLWLYYHRLSDQTLFTCVNDFIDPKLKQVAEEAARLRQKKGRSTADEKELERLTDFERELKDFREELLRVAKFWKPNLNDGVEITAAPLWKLFQHKPWQKRLRETWHKLEAGEYDWAHLAYSIWPERVREKCKTDKSLAIAHDLEHLYVEKKVPLKKGKKKDDLTLFDEGEDGT